ncbi:MAG: HEAT repeat domain-containing protein [Kangiellaceae bacterium]
MNNNDSNQNNSIQDNSSINDKLSIDEQLSLAMKSGNKPHISDQRMDANRWQLKRQLNAQSQKQSSIIGQFSLVFATNKFQIAGMFLTFTLGFVLASNTGVSNLTTQSNITDVSNSGVNSNNNLHERDQIIDLVIDKNSESPNQYNVQYTTLRQTRINTNIENQETLELLTSALKNDLSDSTRLKLVDLLKEHLDSKKVRQSLSYSLLNDPNPGVRMVAAESLAKLASDEIVRDTLRQALIEDTNQGVRVAAFEALLEQLDDKTIELFKGKGSKDGNYYIRSKARNVINEIQQQNDSREINSKENSI